MTSSNTKGGRFDFDDGGTYCGGWEDGKAHGHGLCTGPKGQGEYSGSWHYGFEVSGVYTWPSGSSFEGQWQDGKRHGLGVETRGRWVFRGEWTSGLKGRYGVRQSLTSGAKYEGTWANGLQDGYGSETYADGGSYQGQWLRGMRHGYGVRTGAPFGLASHYRPKNVRGSLTSLRSDHVESGSDRDRRMDTCRGGFVLTARSDPPSAYRRSLAEKTGDGKRSFLRGLRFKKQRSAGDVEKRGGTAQWSLRSTSSNMSSASSESNHSEMTHGSGHTDSNTSFVSQDDITDSNVIETYIGEWKADKRCGFGIAERSDGLRYEGEWYNNRKYGYGVTTLKDGTREEGKYKNNVLITSGKKKHLFLLRSAKFRERVESAVNAAIRGSQIALQKADIAISRTATARGKSEQADIVSMHAREDSDIARLVAKQFAPDFHQPGIDLLRQKLADSRDSSDFSKLAPRREDLTPQLRSRSLYLPTGKETVTASRENLVYPATFREVEGPGPRPAAPNNTLLLDPSTAANPDKRRPSAVSVSLENSYQRRNPSVRSSDIKVEFSFQQALTDHLDHYTIAPSRATAKSPQRAQVFQPSVQVQVPLSQVYGCGPDCTPDSGVSESMDNEDMSPGRAGRRSTLPSVLYAENIQLNFAPGSDSEEGGESALMEDEGFLRLRQEGPVRTGSLYNSPRAGGHLKVSETSRRKKSLPDITALGEQTKAQIMTREEVAQLSSQRREAIRRQEEEAEKLRSNPLLYFFSQDLRDWLSRQQLVMLVLFINISLAIMFFKLLS